MRSTAIAVGLTLFVVVLSGLAPAQAVLTGNAFTEAIDRGAPAEQFPNTPISVTLALRLRDVDEAEKLLIALHTPGGPAVSSLPVHGPVRGTLTEVSEATDFMRRLVALRFRRRLPRRSDSRT
jgi:hypothetical protein